jgi:hypothetical protein
LVNAVSLGDTRDYYGADPWRHAFEAIQRLAGVGYGGHPSHAAARGCAAKVWEAWICWQRAKEYPRAGGLGADAQVTEEQIAEHMARYRWGLDNLYAEGRFESRREMDWHASRLCQYLAAYPEDPPAMQRRPFERESRSGPLLRVVAGGDEGERWRLDTKRVLEIGRGSARTARLKRDPKISRDHCRLRWAESSWVLSNASQSGTRLNGEEIKAPTPIHSASRIEIGASVLALEVFVPPDLERS